MELLRPQFAYSNFFLILISPIRFSFSFSYLLNFMQSKKQSNNNKSKQNFEKNFFFLVGS